MELTDYIQFFVALVFVVSLMGLLAYVLKRIGLGQVPLVSNKKKRIKLLEALSIDARRKIILVGHDDKEHLVLLGPSGDTVITKDIQAEPKLDNES